MSNKWSRPRPDDEPAPRVSEDSAKTAVFALLDFYRIDLDDFPSEQRQGAELILNKLQKAYMTGQLENLHDDKGFRVVQHLKAPPGDVKELTYDELCGKHKIAMDGYKDTETVSRQHALLGSLCGLGADSIRLLKAVDLSVAEDLAFVFFSA